MIFWAWLGSAWACEDPVERLDAAERALETLNIAGADAALQSAESALGCALVEPETVGRFFTLEGIQLALSGDDDGASQRFATAKKRVEMPEFAPYGGSVAALWVDAAAPDGSAALSMEPSIDKPWAIWVDGESVSDWPHTVEPGLHVVQIADRRSRVAHFGRVFAVSDGTLTRIDHQLPPKPPVDTPANDAARLLLTAAVGAELGSGPATEISIDGKDLQEPAVRVVVPVELGLELVNTALWGRLVGFAGPLVTGTYLYEADGEPVGTRLAWGGELSGGLRVGPLGVRPGIGIGARLPSRARLRALVGIDLTPALSIEPGLGLHVLTGGGVEPFGGVALRTRIQL